MKTKYDIIVIGGWLTGLLVSHRLKLDKYDYLLLDANQKRWWRINTQMHNNIPIELGPSWIFPHHKKLRILIDLLGHTIWQQYTKGDIRYIDQKNNMVNTFPSNSMQNLELVTGWLWWVVNTILEKLDMQRCLLNHKVTHIERENKDYIRVDVQKNLYTWLWNITQYYAKKIIFTLPPKTIVQEISFEPALDISLMWIMKKTHTRMEWSIKAALVFSSPFWREKGYSWIIIWRNSIVAEIYDQTPQNIKEWILVWFLDPSSFNLTKKEREYKFIEAVHLAFWGIWWKVLGYYESYVKPSLWIDSYLLPHENNWNKIYKQSLRNNSIDFMGTETSEKESWYLEGAVHSAEKKIILPYK
jgi:monoamine oxidase